MLGVLAIAIEAATVSIGYADFPPCPEFSPVEQGHIDVTGNGSARIRLLIDHYGTVINIELYDRDEDIHFTKPLQETFEVWKFRPVEEACFVELKTEIRTKS